MLAKRKDVYAAIDGERDYQDWRWGGPERDAKNSIGDFIVYMDHYMTMLKRDFSTEPGQLMALDQMRKVIALGVACMEVHGAVFRSGYGPSDDN